MRRGNAPTPRAPAGGDQAGAAAAAVRVALHLLFDTALMAPVRGWLARAQRLLDGRDESAAHAWLAVVCTYERMLTGDLPGARHWARQAIEVGSRCDPAACAIGRVAQARLLILDGEVPRGLALLEQAGVATVSGDLDPLSTGVVYCELVCALQGLAQYDLAEQWTEAMERWCDTNAIGSLHGRCRVHRAEILRLRGSCHEAESQALLACEELRPYLRRELGWPLNELGRIRLHRGDITGAEQALLAAHRAGWDPQPGLALVRLAQADPATAAAAIRDALQRPLRVPSKERPPNTDLARAPLLEAAVQIEIAAGDLARARSAADELDQVAARFHSKALVAAAALARGRVHLADGDAAGAEQSLVRSGPALERGRRPVRGGAGTHQPGRRPHRQRQRAPSRPGAPRGRHHPRRDPSRPGGGPTSTRRAPHWARRGAGREPQRLPPRRGLLDGDLRRAHRPRARPEGHAIPRAAAGRSRTGVPRAGFSSPPRPVPVRRSPAANRPTCRARHSATPARSSTPKPRTPTGDAWPRSTTTSTKRTPPETRSGPPKPTPNATGW